MKKFLLITAVALLATASHAYAGNVGFSIGVNLGYPVPVAPVYVPQPVVMEEPPEFVALPELGFYVAAGVPDDLFYVDDAYYLCRGNVWYTSPYYNGPWETVYYDEIPYPLHRYPFARIHQYRDYYFSRFHDRGDWRGFQHFRPGWHGADREGRGWGGHAYNAPARSYRGNWDRSAYNAPARQFQGNWNRHSYYTNAPGAWGRSVNRTPDRWVQGNRNRPSYNASRYYERGNGGR